MKQCNDPAAFLMKLYVTLPEVEHCLFNGQQNMPNPSKSLWRWYQWFWAPIPTPLLDQWYRWQSIFAFKCLWQRGGFLRGVSKMGLSAKSRFDCKGFTRKKVLLFHHWSDSEQPSFMDFPYCCRANLGLFTVCRHQICVFFSVSRYFSWMQNTTMSLHLCKLTSRQTSVLRQKCWSPYVCKSQQVIQIDDSRSLGE